MLRGMVREEVIPEADVQEMGRRLRSENDAFATAFVAFSETLQRGVVAVVDLQGQALRRLGGEGVELSAQLSEHVLAATITASAVGRQEDNRADAVFVPLRLACVGQIVAAASASNGADQRADLLRRVEEPLLSLGSRREACELWGDVSKLRGDVSLSLCIYAACFRSHGVGNQNAHMLRLANKIEQLQQQSQLESNVSGFYDVRDMVLDENLPFVPLLRQEGLLPVSREVRTPASVMEALLQHASRLSRKAEAAARSQLNPSTMLPSQ
eukprot:gene31732-38352_t